MPELEILTACRFYLELKLKGSNDAVDGIFMDCKGFKCTQEIIEICEVTPNQWGIAKVKQRGGAMEMGTIDQKAGERTDESAVNLEGEICATGDSLTAPPFPEDRPRSSIER